MTLTNYWWLLIWLFGAGAFCMYVFPKQKEYILGKIEYRWSWTATIILTLPYVIWSGFRHNFFGDSLLSSKLQKN